MQRFFRTMIFLTLIVTVIQPVFATSISIEDLGTVLGDTQSHAYGINNNGRIVGWSYNISHNWHACYWENNTSVPRDIGTPVTWSASSGINNNGQIVGWSTLTGHYRACYWENSSSLPKDLGTLPGGINSYAEIINDNGQIVGGSEDGSSYACYWENGTSVPKDLGTLGFAHGINYNGQIVGECSNTSGQTHACYWENSTSVPKDLGTLPGGTESHAWGINNNGQIMGWSTTATGHYRACYWKNSTSVPKDLGTLPGGTESHAFRINDNGQIVGEGSTATGQIHACYWENSASVPTDLGTLPGGIESHTYGINDNGQIVGWSTNATGDHAVLWTAISSTPVRAKFSASPTSGKAPLNVSFTDLSTGLPTSWKWLFGDGGTSTVRSPIHTYNKIGLFSVTLTASKPGISNSVTKSGCISVTNGVEAPVTNFAASPTSGTVPLTVSFNDTSTGMPTSWKWTFGDGGNSKDKNPVHVYNKTGQFSVTLSTTNAGGSGSQTKISYIGVSSSLIPPVAAFSASPTSGAVPLTVNFTDLSTGSPTSFKWTFGDGNSSTQQNPVFTYNKKGLFTVGLTVTNPGGSSTETMAGYISVR